MCGPDIPEPPAPKETSAAQTGTNVATAIANTVGGQVGQVTPDGTLSYDQTGSYKFDDPYTGQSYDIPTFTATTTLSPEGQRLRDLSNETRGNMATVGRDASAFLGDYLTERPDLETTYGTDWSQDRRRVEGAMLERLAPQFKRDRNALQTRLANQGITPGSEAWNREIEAMERSINDARTGVILAGGQEQSRLAGLDRDRATFRNTATLAGRNQPLNEIIGLLTGTQVQTPGFGVAQPARVPTTDVAGNIWDNYNARVNKAKAEYFNPFDVATDLVSAFGMGA